MRKIGKRVFSLTFAALLGVMSLTAAKPIEAKAESVQSHPDWTKESAVWTVSEGVTAQVRDGVLYIMGNGVVPDYTNDTLSQRPWHTSLFGTVMVEKGITDIGTSAFEDFKYLKYFYIPSTTFIADGSVFHKIDNKPTIRIQGTEETTRMIGDKIPYTSLDSLARAAKSMYKTVLYVTDNGTMKKLFREKTYPNISNVFSADNPGIEKPSDLRDEESEKLQDFKSPLRFAPGYEMVGRAVTSSIIKSGVEYLQVVADYLNFVYPDYAYGQTYSNLVTTGDTIYPEFEDTKRYVFQIPDQFKAPGREFKVIMVANGEASVLEDLDDSDATITFATNKGSFTYSIIYK